MIDVPGHEDFVRSMLVGASGIDLGLLVVAADEGVMPQTREHSLILSLLQIPQIVVAITKSDLADADWIELVRADLLSLFAASALPAPAIVICSSRSGTGLDELRAALADRLGAARARSNGDLFRMPVDRAFSVKGTGTVVTGTVWSGELASDGAVVILPSGKTTRARRIEQHSKVSPAAVAGSRAAIALAGVDVSEVARGSVLVGEEQWQTTTVFEAIVSVDPEIRASLSPRTRVRLHAGASEVEARLVFATAGTDRPVLARISTDSAIVLRGGDRFVLRLPAPVRTIGGGVVVDPYARRRSLPIVTPDQLTALGSSALARAAYVVDSEANAASR